MILEISMLGLIFILVFVIKLILFKWLVSLLILFLVKRCLMILWSVLVKIKFIINIVRVVSRLGMIFVMVISCVLIVFRIFFIIEVGFFV